MSFNDEVDGRSNSSRMPHNLSELKVLIADDDHYSIFAIQQTLKQYGIRAYEASDGFQAVQAVIELY